MTSIIEQKKVSRFKIIRKIGYFFDKYDPVLIIIIIITIIIIIILIILLIYNSKNATKNIVEKFNDNDSDNDSSNDSSNSMIDSNNQDKNITNEIKKINNELKPILNNYKNLDVPIIINNSGKICGNWDKYMDGTYSKYGNKCVNIDDSEPSEYYCVNTNDNSLVSCNNYISPNVLENITIDTNELISNNIEFTDAIANYIDVCNKFDEELSNMINSIKSAGSIANNQNYFYENNQNNLDAKKNLNNSFKQIYENNSDEINIKKDNILHYREMTNELTKSNEQMYTIFKYMFIIFIILLLTNVFLTRI